MQAAARASSRNRWFFLSSRRPAVTRSARYSLACGLGGLGGLAGRQRGDEVADDRGRHPHCIRQPGEQRVPRPLGHVHQAVKLLDDLSLCLADRPEHAAVALELAAWFRVLVGLGRAEVDGHHDPLPRARAGGERGTGVERSLRVDHAVAGRGEFALEGVAQEHLVPVPVPQHARRPVDALQHEPGSEHRVGERPGPGERRDDLYRSAVLPQELRDLLEMRVDASGAGFAEGSRDDDWPRVTDRSRTS